MGTNQDKYADISEKYPPVRYQQEAEEAAAAANNRIINNPHLFSPRPLPPLSTLLPSTIFKAVFFSRRGRGKIGIMPAGTTAAGFVLFFLCGSLFAMGECFHRIQQNEHRRRRDEARDRRAARRSARVKARAGRSLDSAVWQQHHQKYHHQQQQAPPSLSSFYDEEHLESIAEEEDEVKGGSDETVPWHTDQSSKAEN